jgi:hypothetical protein
MPFNLPLPSGLSTLISIGAYDSASGTSGSNEIINTTPAVQNNLYIGGTVIDEQNKPIPGVNIVFTQKPGFNEEYNGVIEAIVENLTTNDKGEWSLVFPRTKIDLKSVDIVLYKQEYKSETISNPPITTTYPISDNPVEAIKVSTPETEPPYEYRVGNEIFKNSDQNVAKSKATNYALKANDPKYKGASIINIRKKLYKAPKPTEVLQPLIQPILDEVNKLERTQDQEANKQKLPGTTRIAVRVNVSKEKVKKKLIPFIIKLLLPFGVIAVQAVINKIDIEKIKDQILCPRQDKLLELIQKRNKLVRQINGIYQTVTRISSILTGINTALTAIQVGILAVTIIPFPAPTAAPVGVAKLEEQLKKFRIVINILTLTLAAFGAVLGIILRLLNSLDLLLRECAQSQELPFEQINNQLNLFVNESTGINNQTVINDIQVNKPTYKGFTLELIIDPYNTSQYPKRFAQALTRTGVPVLKTDSSFASDPQVLLDQLKFIIDSNPDLNAG